MCTKALKVIERQRRFYAFSWSSNVSHFNDECLANTQTILQNEHYNFFFLFSNNNNRWLHKSKWEKKYNKIDPITFLKKKKKEKNKMRKNLKNNSHRCNRIISVSHERPDQIAIIWPYIKSYNKIVAIFVFKRNRIENKNTK